MEESNQIACDVNPLSAKEMFLSVHKINELTDGYDKIS